MTESKVIAFSIEGDSMDNGSNESLPQGCYVFVEAYSIDNFKSSITSKPDDFWVIKTKDGYLVKQVTGYVEEDAVQCHSLNPKYQDYIIKLEDIISVYLVTARQSKIVRHFGWGSAK
ncbi:S24 family peptidase [Bacteroides faecalis]|uniref:Peptidase S24/S26A/S26B/S26C domain-containing protein n=1 Tax=Bacteroides faecalis TaxID=2447885 RepID=A0A401LZT4_9BACE|nr:S24 family peptidase [Bacteroides faecalis]GCB37066.1 hypothetical protein KGMB02408_40110 [Bacteroides faecalis]